MGWCFCLGTCIACGRPFTFNPVRVPSIVHPATGTREPVCRDCIERANVQRAAQGMPPIVPHADAYDEVNEEELP